MDASTTLKKLGLEHIFNYVCKDPERNLVKLLGSRVWQQTQLVI